LKSVCRAWPKLCQNFAIFSKNQKLSQLLNNLITINKSLESGPITLLLTPPELTEEENQQPQEGGISKLHNSILINYQTSFA
jgi:hypothetical protein